MRWISALVVVSEVSGSRVSVRPTSRTGCGPCERAAGCGASIVSNWWASGSIEVPAPRDLILKVGDHVNIKIPFPEAALAVMSLFGIPLVGFFAGSFATSRLPWVLASKSTAEAVGAILGVVVALCVTRWLHRKYSKKWVQLMVLYEN